MPIKFYLVQSSNVEIYQLKQVCMVNEDMTFALCNYPTDPDLQHL